MINIKTKIILVEPQMGENIGAAARIMSNFGFDELALISPRDPWPNEKAIAMAVAGSYILNDVKIFSDFTDAIKDVDLLIATASTKRDMQKEILAPYELPAKIPANAKLGIVFGCEKSGLTNHHLSFADYVLNIPTADNHSLNLAQAVAIILYEVSKIKKLDKLELPEVQPASQGEINGMLEHLYKNLARRDYYKNMQMRPSMELNLRNLFSKARLSEQEVRTLRGIIRLLDRD